MNIVIVGCGNIGYEAGRLLAESGDHKLLVIDLERPPYAEAFVAKDNVTFATCDATDFSALKGVLESHADEFPTIDAVISTVGHNSGASPVGDFDAYRRGFDLNFFGNLVPLKVFVPKMIAAQMGRIIVLSSTSAFFAIKGMAAYAASKWALSSLLSSLQSEVSPLGITVDVICPRTIKNRHSSSFTAEAGTPVEDVAQKVVAVLNRPCNSTHTIPMRYRGTYFLERLFPGLLDKWSGLESRSKRRRQFSTLPVNHVLITGASSGLGKELAHQYAKRGCKLTLVARRLDFLSQLKEELEQKPTCGEVTIESLDISEVQAVADFAARLQGDVDLLINNAGSSVVGKVKDVPVEAYKQNFAVNFFGPVRLTSELLKRPRPPKKIINVLSTTAIAGRAGYSSYSATKAALWAFTRSLRRTVGEETQVLEILVASFASDLGKHALRISTENPTPTSVPTPNPNPLKRTLSVGKASAKRVLQSTGLTAQEVATQIMDAEQQGKEILFIPFKARLFLLLEAGSPRLFKRFFG
jgi:short-subunit dehydrogenase